MKDRDSSTEPPPAADLRVVIPSEQHGMRLDQALARLLPEFTRSQLQQWMLEGRITVAGSVPRKRDKAAAGAAVCIALPAGDRIADRPQAIALSIVHEDEAVIVLDKPPGLVVHPGAGRPDGTLLNAILHHSPRLAALPRAGIVHRLDKDTSGLLVVAKTEAARRHLIDQLRSRSMRREYVALVSGVCIAGGEIAAPIARHTRARKRMVVRSHGKDAITHYRVLKRYRAHSLLQLRLESGRTHQIRVHMAHIGFPVLGDPVYGGRLRLPRGCDERLSGQLRAFRRQALHAAKLTLAHPATGQRIQWSASVPPDMSELMESLARDAREHSS